MRIGTSGGSQLANTRALKLVHQKLAVLSHVMKLAPGEVAALMEDFERQKLDLDFE